MVSTALVCLDTLLDIVMEPGWDDDYQDFDERKEAIEKLRFLIDSEHIVVYVPPTLPILAHFHSKARFGPEQAQRIMSQILEIGTIPTNIDYERVLERANRAIRYPADSELFDVLSLIYGQELHVDAILTNNPDPFEQLVRDDRQVFPAFNVPILSVGEFINCLSDTQLGCTRDENFVYPVTPNGKVVRLPKGSTPIDFAYKIHSKIGDRYKQAKVNGQDVPLDYVLCTRDVVEIVKGTKPEPDPKWLDFAVTKTARKGIHRGIKCVTSQRGRELLKEALGREIFSQEYRLKYAADQLNRVSINDLVLGVGANEISAEQVAELVKSCTCYPESNSDTYMNHEEQPVELDPRKWSIAFCCSPLPGDSIIGIAKFKKNSVRVHCADCSRISNLEPEKLRTLAWHHNQWKVQLQLVMENRPDTLRPILNQLSDRAINQDLHWVGASPDGIARAAVNVFVTPNEPLREVLGCIENMTGVLEVKVKGLVPTSFF